MQYPDNIEPAAASACEGPFEERLHLYIDGELAFAEQPSLFAHLATCACCRSTLEAMLAFRRISRQESFVVPPSVDDSFFKRLDHHKRQHNRVDRKAERSLWQARAPVSLWLAATVAGFLFVAGLLVPVNAWESPLPALVDGIEDRVEFADPIKLRPEAVYVFYPGLTVEATKIGP